MPELDRRDFLKLVGVGAGGAAAAGCSDHVEKLIPYVVQPEVITPGIPVFYSSTCTECPAGCGLRVRTRESRPIKLEGNPEHPINRGTLCPRGQAGIGRSYHPDRFRGPMLRDAQGVLQPVTWEHAAGILATQLKQAGASTWVLSGRTGPTLGGLLDRWVDAVGAGGRVVYEPFAYESLRGAAQAVFGVDSQPYFDLEGADLVLDFGADALDAWLSPPEHQRQIEAARDAGSDAGRAARLVYLGPRLSTTASSADEWVVPRPGSEGLLALGIAKVAFDARRAAGQPVGGDPELIGRVLAKHGAEAVARETEVPVDTIRRLGAAMAAAKRPVALPPGIALTTRRGVAAAGAVLLLDAVVGAIGTSVGLPPAQGEPASLRQLQKLVASAKGGAVALLLIHDSNPVYSLPPGLGFGEALDAVGFVVSTASMPDETTERANLVLPDHTPLESWGDAAPRPGIRSVVQPTLRPLYDTQAFGDTLLQVARAMGDDVAARLPTGSFRSVVEAAWSDTDWRSALEHGGVFAPAAPAGAAVAAGVAKLDFRPGELEGDGTHALLAIPSPLLYDGRGAHLPWLQETPDPVTKITWTSWLEVSEATASSLGVEVGDIVAVESAAGRVEVPVFPRGGLRDDVVVLPIGQGHRFGMFASADGQTRGVNAFALLPADSDEAGGRAWLTTKVRLSRTGAHRRLPNVQRYSNDRGRQLGEAITLATLAGGKWNAEARGLETQPIPAGVAPGSVGMPPGGWEEEVRPYDPVNDSLPDSPYRWGMAVDLDRCTGCSACVVACAIENNTPVVGEQGVLLNRQMQWIRIDRFVGPGEDRLIPGRRPPKSLEKLGSTDVRNLPMLCQQCGAAPCEPVCPVLATYHNPEGLNGMIYNRCIGTRYCSNNCPYKVRRFNWFDYSIERLPEPMRLMLNPDVTVRGQGVMEKCTFCIQRIHLARQTAKDEKRPIADGEVVPACAQTCPSNAIVFGNLKDESSRVARFAADNAARSYHALQVLNTRPSITYLARLIREGEGREEG